MKCSGPGTSGDPCSNNYRGRYPFSEPETRSMAMFLWRIRKRLDVYLTLHSYGQYWLTPWGFSRRLPPDYNDLVSGKANPYPPPAPYRPEAQSLASRTW